MRTLLFATVAIAIVCLQSVAAIPHGVHQNLHIKKDYTTAVVTEYTTVIVPEFVVWVDDEGNVVSTETKSGGFSTLIPSTSSTTMAPVTTFSPPIVVESSTSSAAAISATPTLPALTMSSPAAFSTAEATPAPAFETTPAPEVMTQTTETSLVAPTTAAASSTAPTASTNAGSGTAIGVAYDVLKGPAPPSCATDAQVGADIANFSSLGYTMVRIYDITCNQVALVTKYAAQYNMKVFVTIPSIGNLGADLPNAINQAGANTHTIDTIAIGNELVQDGTPVAAIVAALSQARTILQSLNYGGFIVTVDTFGQLLGNPELCSASDYCAANCHAFFTPTISSANAGAYVKSMQAAVSAANGGKRTIITESGWPWAGLPNGAANPSVPDQQAALASLRAAFAAGGIMLFEGYDAQYKALGDFNVEPFWGMYGAGV